MGMGSVGIYTNAAMIAFVILAIRLWWRMGPTLPLICLGVTGVGYLVWPMLNSQFPFALFVIGVGIVMGVVDRAKSIQAGRSGPWI
jgi:hypothetical protein